MQLNFKLPQICSFPHDNGGRLGWGRRSSVRQARIAHEFSLILQVIDALRSIDNHPHPSLTPVAGEGASVVRTYSYLAFKSQTECNTTLARTIGLVLCGQALVFLRPQHLVSYLANAHPISPGAITLAAYEVARFILANCLTRSQYARINCPESLRKRLK